MKNKTNKKREGFINQLKELVEAHGFTKDRFGNFVKEKNGEAVRYKFGKVALRYEARIAETNPYSKSKWRWIRLRSGNYCNLEITEDNKIKGLLR